MPELNTAKALLNTSSNRLLGAVALALALLFLVWVLWGLWVRGNDLMTARTTRVTQTTPSTTGMARGPAQYNIGQIVSAHLFGTKIVKKQPVAQKVVPKTNLRLRLVGILSSDADNGVARALIALESGVAKSYAVGDAIDRTDSTLHSVESGRVLLDRNGRIETLELERKILPPESERKNRRQNARGQSLG